MNAIIARGVLVLSFLFGAVVAAQSPTMTCTHAGTATVCTVTVPDVTTPPPPTLPTITAFTANPATVATGTSATLTWTSANATSATLGGSSVVVSGTQTVTPAATTTYTLTVTNAAGSASKAATVTVTTSAPPSPMLTHNAVGGWTTGTYTEQKTPGVATADACYALMAAKTPKPQAIEYQVSTKDCYAEYGQGTLTYLSWAADWTSYIFPGTAPPPTDTTAPSVQLVAPAGNTTVTGPTAVTATASDNLGGSGVASVSFTANGTLIGSVTSSPYTVTWTPGAAGSTVLTATARDVAGNLSQPATVTVTVNATTPPPPAGLLGPANLVYKGCIQIPSGASGVDNTFSGTALAFNPGGNGGQGSLFISGFTDYGSAIQRVGEMSIPTPVASTTVGGCATATLLHPFVDPLGGHQADITPLGDSNGIIIRGLLVYQGKLIVTDNVSFDTNASGHPNSHFLAKLDLSGYLGGPYQIGSPAASGWVGGYMTLVPPAFQSLLGGTVVTGLNSVSITSRTSYGPTITAFDPANLGVANPVPATRLVGYTQTNHTLGDWSGDGGLYNGGSWSGGVVFDSGSRSVLFLGVHGSGTFCYGAGTDDISLNKVVRPDGETWCYDPSNINASGHGPTNYPYSFFVWAYDANDLAAVKAGTKNFYDVIPYRTWTFTLPIHYPTSGRLAGLDYSRYTLRAEAFDPVKRRIFLAHQDVDQFATTIIDVMDIQ